MTYKINKDITWKLLKGNIDRVAKFVINILFGLGGGYFSLNIQDQIYCRWEPWCLECLTDFTEAWLITTNEGITDVTCK